MKPQPKPLLQTFAIDSARSSAAETQSGVVLINMALQPIALDRGAVNILRRAEGQAPAKHIPSVPEEILSAVSTRRWASDSSSTIYYSAGKRRYRCRLYLIPSDNPALSPAVFAVHFELDHNGDDAISEIVADYHLTEREAEALHGIALGLSTKELADRMRISPNTVKSFVRLIMIKLGVDSRAAIMVKLLENREPK